MVRRLACVDSKLASAPARVDFRVFAKNPPLGAGRVSQPTVIESLYCEHFSKWIPTGFPGEESSR